MVIWPEQKTLSDITGSWRSLSADHCGDVCRILRLPFTLNIPTKVKKAKGRVPVVASLVECDPTRLHAESAFKKAPPKKDAAVASGAASVNLSAGPLPRVDLEKDLPPGVSQRIKAIIVTGGDPVEPGKYRSQSEALWAVCCELVRAGCTDDQIAGVLLDKNFGVSTHIYRQGKPKAYAARQIRRARDEAIDPKVRELNDNHFIVENDGGKCRVCEFVTDEEGDRERLSQQSFDDFRNRYMHLKVEAGKDDDDKPVYMPLGKYWLGHPNRRQYKGLVFLPGDDREIIAGRMNLWRGWGITPKSGTWSLMERHIDEVLADDDAQCAQYIKKWSAYAVQHPGRPAEVALVLKGKPGIGKGIFLRTLSECFGQHGMQVTSADQFIGRFNSHLRDVCLLFADEAITPGDKAATSRLKALLTEPSLVIEGKGKDAFTARNHVKVGMASNDDWVVPVGIEDRRFAVFEPSPSHMKDHQYFADLQAEIDAGGAAAMLHDLLNLPLGNWHPRTDIPDTKARNRQKIETLKAFETDFFDMLCAGELPVGSTRPDGEWFVSSTAMHQYCQSHLRRKYKYNKIAELFKKLSFLKVDKDRPRGWLLPSLPDARAAWDEKMSPGEWDEAAEWTDMPLPC